MKQSSHTLTQKTRPQHFTELYCTGIYYTTRLFAALHCDVLSTALHCTALHCTTALHFAAFSCTPLHCTALHCTALCYSAPDRILMSPVGECAPLAAAVVAHCLATLPAVVQ